MAEEQPVDELLEIVRLGGQGDGLALSPDGPRYVPLALPGETWRVSTSGDFERLADASERIDPPCPHFGRCGGCVAQHMDEGLYAEWKTGLITQALAQQGIEVVPEPFWRAPPGSRRRVVLSAESTTDGGGHRVKVGFRAARSHDLVEISSCVIADPAIVDALPVIRDLLAELTGGADLPADMRVHVLRADNGIDVVVEGDKRRLTATEREALASRAQRCGLLRLRVGGDEIYQRAHPIMQIGGVDLRIPAGVFLQAVAAAEGVMAGMVVKALGRAKNVADLFCGVGTFSLPLARRARVLAVDSQPDAVAALDGAVRHAQGLKPVKCLQRDLFREPISRNELKGIDGVVFDPPRAGAAAQSEALAKSKVPVVVAVSCNPSTMARDLRTLIDGGYQLKSVTPIDQFVFSSHVEVVAVLRR